MYFVKILHKLHILLFLFSQYFCNDLEKLNDAVFITKNIAELFDTLFTTCLSTTMPNQKFVSGNINSYINYPSKTTVGFSPKFTANRKFFANMIGTVAFKSMLEKDVQELRIDLIRKMKYCDEAVMDQSILNDYYDREVDLSK